MALTKEQKQNIVKELKDNIAKQKAMVFVSFEGLKASDLYGLRNELKDSDCLLIVAKKTLLSLAFDKAKDLPGQVALVFGFKDEVMPAKIAYKFSLKNENLKILGGYFDNEIKTAEETIILAKTPSREELLAKVVGSLSAPMSGFVNVLQGNIKGLLNVLKQAKA